MLYLASGRQTLVLLVTGSRVLTSPPGRVPVLRRLIARFCTLADVIVTGDAEGPDTWAREIAEVCCLKKSIWMSHGSGAGNVLGVGPTSWSGGSIKPNDHKARDRAMVDWWALEAAEKPITLGCLALEASWSSTRGTWYTMDRAARAGFFCSHYVFDLQEASSAR